jgi:hypothetical protein
VIGALVLTVVAVAAPARVQVTADEYSLTLSRSTVKAGPAIVELVNLGEDPHDLRIQQLGVKRAKVFGVRRLESQGVGDVERKLVPGRYRLWCSIGNDRALGMVATLRVKR